MRDAAGTSEASVVSANAPLGPTTSVSRPASLPYGGREKSRAVVGSVQGGRPVRAFAANLLTEGAPQAVGEIGRGLLLLSIDID